MNLAGHRPSHTAEDTPERQLLYAILMQGLREAVGEVQRLDSVPSRHVAARARQWLQEDSDAEPCSFVRLCHLLGYDAEYVRWLARRYVT